MLHENDNGRPLGRYRLIAFLDQREFGTTHLAVTKDARPKLVVIKELRQDLLRNRTFVASFLTEAKLAATLEHPNVIRTLEAGRDGDRLFLSMEFLDGQPLSKILWNDERAPRLSQSARIQILCDALAGLEHAHGRCDYDGVELGLVHRDISPQNVFVTYDGEVKVTDFGIARAAEEGDLPRPGFKGKLAYASPEQLTGQPIDRRTDVFAIGVMLWESIAMRRFAPGAPTRAAIEKRALGREPRIMDVVPDVEPLLAEICDRAMHVDPKCRYASARELRQALLTFLLVDGESTTASEIGQVVRAKFSQERAEMHQLIRANVKEGELPESMRDPASHPQADDDGPTRIADLSRYADTTEVIATLPAEERVDRAVTTIEPMTTEPVTFKPVTIEPVTTEPVTTEPPPSRVRVQVPPPARQSGAPRARNRVRMWTTGGAVALAAFAYLALHARPHAAPVPSSPAGVSRTTTPVPEPAPLPPMPQAPASAMANATPPALEISDLPPDRPGSMGKLRLRRTTTVRALAALRERPAPRPNPPSPSPVAPARELGRTSATPEKPHEEVQMGQDLNRHRPVYRPRTIDPDNPFQ